MSMSLSHAFVRNFLGNSPTWYKWTIGGFLAINPLVLWLAGSHAATIAAWLMLIEFIFTLAMALKCYPLQPGGLLALEAVIIGLTSPASVYQKRSSPFRSSCCSMFMVAGIYFLKDLLVFRSRKSSERALARRIGCHRVLRRAPCCRPFLMRLTVVAVVITVGAGFYQVFHRYASGKHARDRAR